MATSGRMNASWVNIGGYGGRMYVNWQRAAVNESANQSTINWQAYFSFDRSDAQLDGGHVDAHGRRWTNGGRVYNYTGNFSSKTIHLASGHFALGHDGNGNRTLGIGAGISVYGSGYSGGNGSWALPQIYRNIAINSWTTGSVNVTSFNVNVKTNRTADLVDYSLNGGGWKRGYTGDFTNRTFTIGSLKPGTTYSVKVRVRRKDSGKTATSGLKSITTTAVNVTSLSAVATTDTSISISANTSHLADQFRYRLNGGSYVNSSVGDFTSKTVEVPNLQADQLYTVEASARHKSSQTWTSNKKTTVQTQSPKALQPIHLTPSSGIAIQDLTPTLEWDYTSTSPDAQTAYQVLIKRESDGSVVWDSGKVSTSISAAEVPAANELSFNVAYQWQVRTWSTYDVAGPYSELVIFKTSRPPTAVVTSPENGSFISTNTPIITWDYSDPEDSPQIGYTLEVMQIANPGDTTGPIAYSTTMNNTDADSAAVPVDELENGQRYAARVTVVDSDNLVGTSDWIEFEIRYITPPAPGIELELSENELFVRIAVTTNKPDDDSFSTDAIKIYKRELGASAWEYIDTVQGVTRYLEDFEDPAGWTYNGTATEFVSSEVSREGSASLSAIVSGAGMATFTKDSSFSAIENSDKIRMWLYTESTSLFNTVAVRIGSDVENYYSFTLNPGDLQDSTWNSVEVDLNDLDIVGNPSLGNITWQEITVDATGPIDENELLFDGLRLAQTSAALFVYDYILGNNKTYEYSAIAFNTREELDSGRTTSHPLEVKYSEYSNTYLVPIGAETESVIAYMSGDSLPAWTTTSKVEYHAPVAARLPVAYSLGIQKYRSGSVTLLFLDNKHDCDALEAARSIEHIMEYKPLLLRTWWGDNIYISIDGQVTLTKERLLGWTAEFDFTEVSHG